MLALVKLALRITIADYDNELNMLIEAALLDLGIAGVTTLTTTDNLILRAVTTYCKMNFGTCDKYAELKASYDEQKAQLSMSSRYTTFAE